MNELTIMESRQYERRELIDIGISVEVPMRLDIKVPRDVDPKPWYDRMAKEFKMQQYEKDERGRDVVRYGDHDIHFWCAYNRNDMEDDLSFVKLSFNEATSVAERFEMKERVLAFVRDVFTVGKVVVEYKDEVDDRKAEEKADEVFKALEGKKCTCRSRDSIIVIVGAKEMVGRLVPYRGYNVEDLKCRYAFKPLRSRKYVYPRTDVDVCLAKVA